MKETLSERKTGAIYIRVSTDKQEELSPDAQLRLLMDYAKTNHTDIPMEYIFQDNGISGRKANKRPAFQQMIALAKSKEHPIDTIIVWKFSRFARNQEESIVYKSLLKKNNVDVVSVSEPLIDGPFGSLIERIIEWMDEYYSIRLSGEVMRGMTQNALRGHYQGDAPIGYQSPGNKKPPEKDPKTIQIPIMMKDLLLSGSSLLQIARKLNEHGYRTKHGNLWDARGVRYVLENPFYAGISRWNYTDRGRQLKPADEVIYTKGNWERFIYIAQLIQMGKATQRCICSQTLAKWTPDLFVLWWHTCIFRYKKQQRFPMLEIHKGILQRIALHRHPPH